MCADMGSDPSCFPAEQYHAENVASALHYTNKSDGICSTFMMRTSPLQSRKLICRAWSALQRSLKSLGPPKEAEPASMHAVLSAWPCSL